MAALDPTVSTTTAPAPKSEILQNLPLLAAAAISVGFGMAGMVVLSLGVFAGPVTAELGWSLGFFQLAAPLLLPPMMAFGPVVGTLADRYGSHRVAVPSLVLFGLALAALGLVTPAPWTWIVGWLTVGLTGCGTSGLAWAPAITARFDRQRGLALAIMLTGPSVVAVAVPSLGSGLIAAFGWRWAYVGLGMIPALIAAPLVAVLTLGESRRRREAAVQAAEAPVEESGATLAEALRDHRFWLISGSLGIIMLAVGGLIANMVPIMIGRGHALAEAAGMASVLGLALIFGSLVTGFLVDRFRPQVVVAAVMALPVLSMPLLLAGPAPAAMTGIALMGVAAGAEFNLVAYLCGRVFGRRQFGRIYALMIIPVSLASSLGGPLLGLVHDWKGAFDPALVPVTVAIVGGAGALLFLRIPAPVR